MNRVLKLLLSIALAGPLAAQDGVTFFETRVRPVLARACYTCHSAQAKTPFAGLRADSREGLLRGGDHGPAIVPGQPEASRLVAAIRHRSIQMPPAGKLPEEEIVAIEKWIAMGAPWPASPVAQSAKPTAAASKHWAWQSVQAPTGATIDGLIEQKLAATSLRLSPPAARRTLLRRLHHDLTGLAPTAEDYQAFEKESAESAVTRLLASPHFGERWARHWLDLARFSDAGFNNIRFGYGHAYRDWVIAAFNRDLPYNEFITHQLAADKLPGNAPGNLAALGFLALGADPHRASGIADKLDDRIDTTTRTFLGLTVACARCHDHKYDPIPTRDYYSLYGIFLNTVERLEPVATGPVAAHPYYDKQLARRLGQLDAYQRARIAELRTDARELEPKYRAAAVEARGMTGAQVENLARERNLNSYVLNRWLRKLAGELPGNPEEIPLEDFAQVQTEGDYNTTNNLAWEYRRLLSDAAFRLGAARAPAVRDRDEILPAHILIRGNPADPGERTPRRFLSLLCGDSCPEFRNGSGRLELARAIASPGNPLTARVLVNRVWTQLFGEGLVRTPSDFGTRGESPTHPELLDHLARAFIDDGWSVKRLIRRIVLTRVYQQTSASHAPGRERDPDNRLLWRQNRRRMDFEALRDAMLLASGRLDKAVGGPSFSLQSQPAEPRRTMYAHVERERAQALLRSFNTADPEQHTPVRYATTVPQQALFLINSPFVAEQAERVAARSQTIEEMYRAILGRSPGAAERDRAITFAGAANLRPAPQEPGAWRYGAARIDAESGRLMEFRPFAYFATGVGVPDAWQAGSLLPGAREGAARLTASGGAPGDDLNHAVARRWVAPSQGEISIQGTLALNLDAFDLRFGYTNGVRGRVIHSRLGQLGEWTLRHDKLNPNPTRAETKKEETNLHRVAVVRGDTIDFVVDALDDYEGDNFTWAPVITGAGGVWNAAKDFHGPDPGPLSRWGQLAQVLLMTNEFAFID